jgi:hypothetical protein
MAFGLKKSNALSVQMSKCANGHRSTVKHQH